MNEWMNEWLSQITVDTLRCVLCLSSPAAAMYVLPIVLIFSTPLYLGFDNSWITYISAKRPFKETI